MTRGTYDARPSPDKMNELLKTEFNIFALIATGFLLRKIRFFDEHAQKVLTGLVLYVVLPCNIFMSFQSPLTMELVNDFLWTIAISVIVQLIAFFYIRFVFRSEEENHRLNLSYAMVSPNGGLLGNTVADGLYGSVGLMVANIFLIPQRIVIWSYGLSLFTGINDKKSALRTFITHPCVDACLLGLIFMITGISLPGWLLSPVSTLGKCNTALSMIVIGILVGDIPLRSMINKTIVVFSLHRLVVVPLITFFLCSLLPMSKTAAGVCVLMAAMPAGATTSMLASRYDRDPVFAAELVMFSTLCSIPAIMLWMLVIG